jgi:hypothetical protein
MLVRLTPARWVNDDLSASGSLYSMTFPFPVAKVQRNGVDLTNDGSTPDANGEWLWIESTQTLQIYSTSAPSSTVAFVVFYHVFVSNRKTRIAAQDPEAAVSSTNPLRDWEPRLQGNPRIKQSVKTSWKASFPSMERRSRLPTRMLTFRNI